MGRRFTYATCLTWGGDEPTAEVEVEVSFKVVWGRDETPPAYSHGGLPADPDEIDDIRLETVEGKPRPWGMGYGYLSDDDFEQMVVEKLEDHADQMIAEATAIAADDHHQTMEDRAERRAEDLREAL